MATAIRVKRHGIGTPSSRKVPFRMWLNKQPRSALTYRTVSSPDKDGWTVEDFALEATHRGVDVRIMTVYKWCQGSQPREVRFSLDRIFPGIKF